MNRRTFLQSLATAMGLGPIVAKAVQPEKPFRRLARCSGYPVYPDRRIAGRVDYNSGLAWWIEPKESEVKWYQFEDPPLRLAVIRIYRKDGTRLQDDGHGNLYVDDTERTERTEDN